MEEKRDKKGIMKVFAVFLMVFSVIFGGTLKNGFCLGDKIFEGLGLTIWSEGTQGTHYPAILGLVLFAVGCGLFIRASEDKGRTKRYLAAVLVLIAVVTWLIGLAV